MTLTQLIARINVMYDSTTEALDPSDDDYTIRLNLINAAIDSWGRQELWRELLINSDDLVTSQSFTIPITTDGSKKAFDMPADFNQISGAVRLVKDSTVYYTYAQIEPGKIQSYDNDTTSNVFYIGGNSNSGYQVVMNSAPATGYSLKFEYYKKPTQMTTGTDVPEMSDPNFIVYFVLSKLFENDGASAKSIKAYQEMGGCLDGMVQENIRFGWSQDTSIQEPGFKGFGY